MKQERGVMKKYISYFFECVKWINLFLLICTESGIIDKKYSIYFILILVLFSVSSVIYELLHKTTKRIDGGG